MIENVRADDCKGSKGFLTVICLIFTSVMKEYLKLTEEGQSGYNKGR